jgi:anti-sigma factor RsiW
MTCRELIDILGDYLEGELGPDVISQFERHLADCAPCRAYLATYRKTRELTPGATAVEMPEEMRARLRRFLAEVLGREGS